MSAGADRDVPFPFCIDRSSSLASKVSSGAVLPLCHKTSLARFAVSYHGAARRTAPAMVEKIIVGIGMRLF